MKVCLTPYIFKAPGDWAIFIVWIQDEEMLVDCINDRIVLPVPVLDTCIHVAMFQMQVSEDCVVLLHSLYTPPAMTEQLTVNTGSLDGSHLP